MIRVRVNVLADPLRFNKVGWEDRRSDAGTSTRTRVRRGFSLMEVLVAVALLGLFAGATLWTARSALDRQAAATAAAGLARLDADARRLAANAAPGGGPLVALVRGEAPAPAVPGPVLRWDLREQEARLVDAAPGARSGPRDAVRLPGTLRLREVWVAGATQNPVRSGVASVPFAAGPPTYAVELREAGVSRWVLVAGATGQRTVLPTRRSVAEVIGAL